MDTDPLPSSQPAELELELLHVFWHEGMLDHNTGSGVFDTGFDPGFLEVLDKHPENADRVRNMVSILRKGPISRFLTWHSGRPAHASELLSFHSPEYIESLIQANVRGSTELCAGTFLNPGSWGVALLAAGSTMSAMDHILSGRANLAYSLVRPPGHHAQPTRADGYCFLNNAGLAVKLALKAGVKRIVTIDIDVHYGNGTAEGFYDTNDVLTVSLHMNHGSWGPSHPQSGSIDELGEGSGYGYNLNIPLPNGSGDEGYQYAFDELVVPAVRQYKPEIIVFIIGQDSSMFDPNGRQCLTMDGYRKIGKLVRDMADEHSNGRLLIVQEGGYHITYSAYCLHATIEGVLNVPEPLLEDPIAGYPEDSGITLKVVDAIKRYWKETIPFLKDI
ncbi:Histone deacetylase 8 [Rhynchospora pubera]|uniref:Histone deacetylase 8 n=1 Tax=Rhynchospora pubera TaxID=906938 RepID=A0AAV8GA35_9POAL|nr:Histone deacetylase 8 [Rhynchospora pubera]